MAGDFNKPVTTDNYSTLLQEVRDLASDMVKGLDPALALGTLNIPTNALRWNSANGYWEKYNGTSWAALASSYAINISGSAAKWGTGRTLTLTGDATGTSGAWDGSANLSFAVTLATINQGSSGSLVKIALDSKGRVTGNTAVTLADLTGLGVAPLDAPALSGAPTAPTPGLESDNTAIATAAFVRARIDSIAITDWDTTIRNGTYMGNSAANAPATGWFIGKVEAHTPLWVTQVVYAFDIDSAGDTKMYRRHSYDNSGVIAWYPWYRLRTSQDELDARYAALAGSASQAFSASALTLADKIIFPTNGYIDNNHGVWGAIYRPSQDGSSASHLWTNASGGAAMYLSGGGALALVSGLSATYGNFSGAVSGTTGTFSGAVSGTKTNGGKVTVASAATPDIFGAAGQFIDYTGTATATGFTAAPSAGMVAELYCAGECKFTAGANLIIEGISSGRTVTMKAGATVKVRAVTTTQFKMTYSLSGEFTITATGFTVDQTGTAKYSVVNGNVILTLPSLIGSAGVSNSTAFTLTGLPVCIRPFVQRFTPFSRGVDNTSTNVNVEMFVETGGTITVGTDFGTGWTASGGKYIYLTDLAYNLN